MGILLEAVVKSQEPVRKVMLEQLEALGICEFKGRPITELNYYEVRDCLAVAVIRIDADDSKWF